LEKDRWLVNKGKWDGAIAEFREAVLLDPKDELTHNRLGYPARRTKSKPSRQSGIISACIIHRKNGRGSPSEEATLPCGSSLWPRRNRTMEQTMFSDYESRLKLDDGLIRMRGEFEAYKEQLREKLKARYRLKPPSGIYTPRPTIYRP